MKKVLTILLFSILIPAIIFFYIFYTESGKKLSYNILGFAISQKIGLTTRVLEFDLHEYPYMKAKLLIEKKYKLDIDGTYENKKFDLYYTLTSKYIQSDASRVKSDVNITGKIDGPRKQLTITGTGIALDGNISYSGIKHRHWFNNVHIEITDINSSKLFSLLGQKAIFQGKANGYMHFDIISHKKRQGMLYYSVKDKDYHGLEVDLDAQIEIDDENHNFTLEAKTSTASLQLLEGKYNQKHKKASAVYVLDVKNVTDIKPIVKVDYNGPFYATGELSYEHKKISMQGFSESFGGVLDLVLKENKLYFYLDNIPLAALMQKADIDAPFDTNITGDGLYDIKKKALSLNTTLSPLVFNKSKLTDSFLRASGVDLSKELFDNNHLHLHTVKGKLLSTLKLSNTENHLELKDTYINSNNHSIKTDIDLKLSKYALKGALFVKIDKYTVSHDAYVNFDGYVQKHYALKLNGLVNKEWASMDYALYSKRLPSHICTIVDDVNVSGHINGPFKRLHIAGKGIALDGNISYEALYREKHFEDVELNAQNIHALKLSTLLGYPQLPYGKGDLKAAFSYLSQKRQKGDIYYWLRDATLFNLPFTIDTRVKVRDKEQKFTANITLSNAKLTLTKGLHRADTGVSKTFYTLDVSDLTPFEALLGYKYHGAFYAVGTATYDREYLIHGLSKTFNGYTEFIYDKDVLKIDLSDVSFKRILALFPYPQLLDASTTGGIEYDFKKKKLRIRSKLKDVKFFYHKEMDTLYRKTDINLLKEKFSRASLDVDYQNNTVLGNIIMESNTSHLSLTNAQIDTKLKTINGYFDVKMQGKEFSGKVYGPLEKPKINLNMQKLIRHEMDKQLDSIMGESNRKMMENMPMGNAAKDMASGMGGAFMGIFF